MFTCTCACAHTHMPLSIQLPIYVVDMTWPCRSYGEVALGSSLNLKIIYYYSSFKLNKKRQCAAITCQCYWGLNLIRCTLESHLIALDPLPCITCNSFTTHKDMHIHLSLAFERQEKRVGNYTEKGVVLFKVHFFRQVKRTQVTHLAPIFETAKWISWTL